MLTLVVGAAASGKSEYAEKLILNSDIIPRYYIATMEIWEEESARRVEKHRGMRKRKCFETVECPRDLAKLHLPKRGNILLECLGNLAANELYAENGTNVYDKILNGLEHLCCQGERLVIVSNDVFTGGKEYAGDTERYLRLLGALHCAIAERADNVCEVTGGLPVYYKGGER